MKRLIIFALIFLMLGMVACTSSGSETAVAQTNPTPEIGDQAFTVDHSITTAADPYVAWRTLTAHIDQWWNPAHSWSGEAARLYLKAERGGCFCERLPDGRVLLL